MVTEKLAKALKSLLEDLDLDYGFLSLPQEPPMPYVVVTLKKGEKMHFFNSGKRGDNGFDSVEDIPLVLTVYNKGTEATSLMRLAEDIEEALQDGIRHEDMHFSFVLTPPMFETLKEYGVAKMEYTVTCT